MTAAAVDAIRSSPQVVVRPLLRDDTETFFAAVRASIDSLSHWMPWCSAGYAFADAERWTAHCETAWAEGSEYPLGIFDRESGALVGGTGINHLVPAYRMGNIGYWVGSAHTGRGIATQAAAMAADIGFRGLGFTRLEIVVLTNNIASHRVAGKLGARQECIARNRLYSQGQPAEAVVYSLVPSDVVFPGIGAGDAAAA